MTGWKKPYRYQIRNSGSGLWLGLFLQWNKLIGGLGGARQSGNNPDAAEVVLSSRCASIFWITAGSSILAIILTKLVHSLRLLVCSKGRIWPIAPCHRAQNDGLPTTALWRIPVFHSRRMPIATVGHVDAQKDQFLRRSEPKTRWMAIQQSQFFV